MTPAKFAEICKWDKRCGDNEGTMFGTTVDRRRLIEYVKELEPRIAALEKELDEAAEESHRYYQPQIDTLIFENGALTARCAVLEKALREFGQHTTACLKNAIQMGRVGRVGTGDYLCLCGIGAALAPEVNP